MTNVTEIAHGYAFGLNMAAFVVGPTGLGLHGPLALALAPNGHLLTSNGDAINPPVPPQLPSEVVEFTKDGRFISQLSIDSVAGAAFGIAVARQIDDTARFAAVNDDDNTIIVLELNAEGF